MIPILGGASAFCAVWALYFYMSVRKERKETLERINKWTLRGVKELSWSDSLVDKLDEMAWAKRLQPQLEQAVINLRPPEYMAITIAVGVGLFFFLIKGFGVPAFTALSITIIGIPFGSQLLLRSRKNIYQRRLEAQLPEACRLLSSAARAGLSIPQGIKLVVNEMTAPMNKELGTVFKEVQLGRDVDVALKEFQKRFNSRDINVFVNALIIQRRAGGDIAKVLSEMAKTMEERKIIHKTIQSLTAQSRSTAYALPIASLFILFILSKVMDGFDQLFTTFFGIVIVIIFLMLQALGLYLVWKFSQIRV